MLIAEDLLLLITDDESGKHMIGDPALDLGLAGACLLELAERGHVDLAREGETTKAGRLVVRNPGPTGDTVLDEALRRCAEKQGKKPATVLHALTKGLRAELLGRLAARGVVRLERGKLLGIFPTKRWPAVDTAHEAQVRRLVGDALGRGTTPDQRTAALIALLSAVDGAHRVVDKEEYGVNAKTIKKRAKEVRESAWAAGAVSSAIEAVQAAITASIIASTVATTSSSG